MTGHLKSAVAESYRRLSQLGLNIGSAGNVSARVGDRVLITRTGATDAIDADGVVEIDLDGAYEGDLAPSSEWEMHTAIYRAAPRAAAVVHTHSDACTALACLGEGLPPFHYMVLGFGGPDVRCAPYFTFGTPALAAAAAEAIQDRTACLLANHGMICHGRSLEAAVATALRLETLARQYLMARAVAPPKLLSPEQVAEAQERFKTYGQPKAGRRIA
ncbi:class II aldolase/adducin family protein [Phenylobacterium conjunctum]|uniref:Class II aldolase/adducin family protein n=1 Tax=Phenylobacterium conjunctum TaxID=1298959 RepID=A0ABW3T646_9CAUL